eukprot:jgi/Chrzof1/2241/Cz11g08040.t1
MMTTSDPYWHPYTEPVYAAVFYLLSNGADPNMPFPDSATGKNPLIWAAYDGRVDMVIGMINAGGNVNYTDNNWSTPLHAAAVCDFRLSCDPCAAATVTVLIAYGADLNANDANGKTPFNTMAGYPTCEGKGKFPDASNCPKACTVLKNGVPADQAQAIKAGNAVDDGSRAERHCCTDPTTGNQVYSQCCISASR